VSLKSILSLDTGDRNPQRRRLNPAKKLLLVKKMHSIELGQDAAQSTKLKAKASQRVILVSKEIHGILTTSASMATWVLCA